MQSLKNQKQTEINEPNCPLSWWHGHWSGIKVTLEHINLTVIFSRMYLKDKKNC